jgi:hypothetical protein
VPPEDHVPEVTGDVGMVKLKVPLVDIAVMVPEPFNVDGVIPVTATVSPIENP